MKKIYMFGHCLLLASSAKLFATPKIEVMIVSTYHFANPGKDVQNIASDDVLQPKRQKEIMDVVNRISLFKPNKIAIERVADRPGITTSLFEKFNEQDLGTQRSEVYQIGFRLASKLKHKAVYAIDEQSETVNYFPYEAVELFAKTNNRVKEFDELNAWTTKNRKEKIEQFIKTETIRAVLFKLNQPQYGQEEMSDFYYSSLHLADEKSQPAAELNGAWYLRNAKIFSKLLTVAKPGEKILVLFGAGHSYWLRHFCSLYPQCKWVEANQFLK